MQQAQVRSLVEELRSHMTMPEIKQMEAYKNSGILILRSWPGIFFTGFTEGHSSACILVNISTYLGEFNIGEFLKSVFFTFFIFIPVGNDRVLLVLPP